MFLGDRVMFKREHKEPEHGVKMILWPVWWRPELGAASGEARPGSDGTLSGLQLLHSPLIESSTLLALHLQGTRSRQGDFGSRHHSVKAAR